MIELIQYRIVPISEREIEFMDTLIRLTEKYSGNVTFLNKDTIKQDIIKIFISLEEGKVIEVINENKDIIDTEFIFQHIANRMILMFITCIGVETIYIDLTNYTQFYTY